MIEIREFLGPDGRNPFSEWFKSLHAEAARRVTIALFRLGLGNFSSVKRVGAGVSEYRIDFGPGYRIYFGQDGETLILLLCGGTKQKQQNDIENARVLWQAYKREKRSRSWD